MTGVNQSEEPKVMSVSAAERALRSALLKVQTKEKSQPFLQLAQQAYEDARYQVANKSDLETVNQITADAKKILEHAYPEAQKVAKLEKDMRIFAYGVGVNDANISDGLKANLKNATERYTNARYRYETNDPAGSKPVDPVIYNQIKEEVDRAAKAAIEDAEKTKARGTQFSTKGGQEAKLEVKPKDNLTKIVKAEPGMVKAVADAIKGSEACKKPTTVSDTNATMAGVVVVGMTNAHIKNINRIYAGEELQMPEGADLQRAVDAACRGRAIVNGQTNYNQSLPYLRKQMTQDTPVATARQSRRVTL